MQFPAKAIREIDTTTSSPQLERKPGSEYPLALNQQHMWFECQLDPESCLYNLNIPMEISGPLHIDAFVESIQSVVDHHEIMRTAFMLLDENTVQKVTDEVKVRCPVVDLSFLPPGELEKAVLARMYVLGKKAFDLDRGPLFRFELVRGGEMEHYFLFSYHHLILDGFYCGQFMQEIAIGYERLRRGESLLPAPKFQYGDFCLRQQEQWKGGFPVEQVAFWNQQLREPWPELQLPIDCPVPVPRPVNFHIHLILDRELVKKLSELGKQHQTTTFRVLLATLGLFFSCLTNNDEVMLDVDFSTRPREMGHTIGHFANIVPIRFNLQTDDNFHKLLAKVDLQLRQASTKREFPVRQLARKLKPARDPICPLSTILVTQVGVLDIAIGDLHLRGTIHPNAMVHDLWLGIIENTSSLEIGFGCAPGFFSDDRIKKWALCLRGLLEQVAADPALSLLEISLRSGMARTLSTELPAAVGEGEGIHYFD